MQAQTDKITLSTGEVVPLTIQKNIKAKRIILRLARDRSAFVLVVPYNLSIKKAQKFIIKNEQWLCKYANLIKPPQETKKFGLYPIDFLGETLNFENVPNARQGVWKEQSTVYVSGESVHMSRRIEEYFKKELLRYIKNKIGQYANVLPEAKSKNMGGKVTRITIRKNSSRWGSCSSLGTLSFNYSLGFVPPEALDYVIAHELAHFKQMNHSYLFWKEVEALYPNYKRVRANLKKQKLQK